MSDPFVIVGGDAAGMSAASKAKREDPDREVIVLERGEWVSYGACGLPYYVKGEIADLEDLVAIPAERFREERQHARVTQSTSMSWFGRGERWLRGELGIRRAPIVMHNKDITDKYHPAKYTDDADSVPDYDDRYTVRSAG